MVPLPRAECKRKHLLALSLRPYDFTRRPLQLGLLGDPWAVAVASVLLSRTRREQMDGALAAVLEVWPEPWLLATSSTEELESVLRPCGFHRTRTRQLQRMSSQWTGDGWEDMRELTGVGKYVANAVGLFCFGCTELESSDAVLRGYADAARGPAVAGSGAGGAVG